MSYIESLTIGAVIKWIFGIIAFLGVFIQITPIKISPISWLLSKLGKAINKDISDKVSILDKKIETVSSNLTQFEGNCAENGAITCRVRILQFGDELRRHVKHSKENFDQVLDDIDTYELYCKENPDFKNSKTAATEQIIRDTYTYCVEHNDFL